MRHGVDGADIAFDGDRELYWRPTIFLQRRSIGLHQRHYLAEPAGVDDEPRITNPRRAPNRYVCLSGDIERRSTRTTWPHADAGVIDGVEPALVAHSVLGPQPTHQGNAFVEPRRPLTDADADSSALRP